MIYKDHYEYNNTRKLLMLLEDFLDKGISHYLQAVNLRTCFIKKYFFGELELVIV